MKIRTLWENTSSNDDVEIWLVAAVDEYTEEAHSGTPEFYQKEIDANPARRELILEIPYATVEKLFRAPVQQVMTAYPPKEVK